MTMDFDEFRVMLSKSKMDVWTLIETAITVASLDYGEELRDRRDKIVEKLYFTSSTPVCRNCENAAGENHREHHHHHQQRSKSPLTTATPESNHGNDYHEHKNNNEEEEEDELDPYGGLFDDEQTRILELKERLEDLDQSEESIIELLQTLADMDITFQVLKATDIGKYVNRYRKHHSKEVKDLVKLLVSKWRETVDEWVKLDQASQASADPIADEDSPQQNVRQKVQQNGHHQGSDFAHSPNPQNGGSSSERNYSEPERKPKPVPSRGAPSRPLQSAPKSVSAPPPNRPKESTMDLEKLNSARRRLHENYQEAENGLILHFESVTIVTLVLYFHILIGSHLFVVFLLSEAKKQKKIQVMDIHEIPKPKNAFFAKNKGGFQGWHQR